MKGYFQCPKCKGEFFAPSAKFHKDKKHLILSSRAKCLNCGKIVRIKR